MGKIWKSSIMPVTYITPNNSPKPRDVTYRLRRVRPSDISTFVNLAPAWGGPRMPPPAPTPSFANAGFIITHPNRRSGHIHPVTGSDNQSWTRMPTPPDVAEAHKMGSHHHAVPRGSELRGPGGDARPLGSSHAGSCSETQRWGRRFHPPLSVFPYRADFQVFISKYQIQIGWRRARKIYKLCFHITVW